MPLTSKIKQEIQDGVYAYISSSAPTTCTDAGSYYFLNGTFDNEVMERWDIVPPLTYLGCNSCGHLFEVIVNASFTSNTGANLIHLAIFKNGLLQTNSITGVYIKNTAEEYSVSTIDVIQFEIDDTVDIRISSSQAGSEVTADHMTTSLKRFF